MKKWNSVFEMLSDPAARQEYDRWLDNRPAEVKARLDYPVWLAPLLAAILIAAFLVHPAPTRPPVFLVSPPPAQPTVRQPPSRRPRTYQEPAKPVRSVHEEPVEIPEPSPDRIALPSAEPIRPPAPAPTHVVLRNSAALPAPLAHRSLAGDWLFVPPVKRDPSALYPPEYVELRITEASGMLRGRYRARYRVTDRAISPDVAFQFEGRPESAVATIPWTGAGGASGDLTLKQLDNGALEVSWTAHELGSVLGLISGTATLVRKLE